MYWIPKRTKNGNKMIKKFIITADVPEGVSTDSLKFSITNEIGEEDYSSEIEELKPIPRERQTMSLTNINLPDFENVIDPSKPNLIDTVFTQRIYFEDGEVMWESECSEEVQGKQVAVYARMIDGTLSHLADFLEKGDAELFAILLMRFSKKVRYPKK